MFITIHPAFFPYLSGVIKTNNYESNTLYRNFVYSCSFCSKRICCRKYLSTGCFSKGFEGKPCINSPRAIGNYPASPFLFYIPTTGQRPMEWSAEKLPKGLKLDSKTGII